MVVDHDSGLKKGVRPAEFSYFEKSRLLIFHSAEVVLTYPHPGARTAPAYLGEKEPNAAVAMWNGR